MAKKKKESEPSISWNDFWDTYKEPRERYSWTSGFGWHYIYYSHEYLGKKKIASFKNSADAQSFVRAKEKELVK